MRQPALSPSPFTISSMWLCLYKLAGVAHLKTINLICDIVSRFP